MRYRMSRLLVLVAVAFPVVAARAAAANPEFPNPATLRPQVEFWKKIFGVYSEHQILVHDTEHLDRVYSVLDYRNLADAGESAVVLEATKRKGAERETERIRALLLSLDARNGNDGGLDEEERKIWNLFAKDKNRRKFARAAEAKRIRTQGGLKERFREGIRVARRYLAEMEEIFRHEGVPVPLTRLPLVESCFDINAYSKAGAAGIWQFMPATARSYLRVGGVLDERRDPLRATRGAARHLKENYEALGTWPLAITAYNHGRAGMRRAVRTVGTTDIARIVRTYRGPLFGFASRNFYAEFLAALEIEGTHREYFGELHFEEPFKSDEVPLRHALSGEVAARCADITPEELAALNPAVDSVVFRGRGNIPRGYSLRVPAGTAGAFQQRLAQIATDARVVASAPSRKKSAARLASTSRGGGRTAKTSSRGQAAYRKHRVARGQTLSHIARRYRVSVERLKRTNNLRGTAIRAGQVLKIPSQRVQAAYRTHRVARGQTLSHIARRYRVSVERLKRTNNLRGTTVKAGQVLKIPAG